MRISDWSSDVCSSDLTAAQIIEYLEAVEPAEPVAQPAPVAAGYEGKQPEQDLPVAAHPPVPSPREIEVAGRKALVDDDIARQRRAAMQAFEQIMTEDRKSTRLNSSH